MFINTNKLLHLTNKMKNKKQQKQSLLIPHRIDQTVSLNREGLYTTGNADNGK